MNPSPFGHQKGLMNGHDLQSTPCVASGHSMIFSDANRVEFNHEFAIVFPAMNVRRLMIPRVNPHVEAVFSKNGRHVGSIIEPLGFCQSKPVCARESRFFQATGP